MIEHVALPDDFRKASEVELARRAALAGEVVATLAAAGLHAEVHRLLDPRSAPGAVVTTEPDEDLTGLPTVVVDWQAPWPLSDAAMDAVMGGRFDDPAVEVAGGISEAMQPALLRILLAAGYSARESENEYAPFAVEILEADAPS